MCPPELGISQCTSQKVSASLVRQNRAVAERTDTEDKIQKALLLGKKGILLKTQISACGNLGADQPIQVFFPQSFPITYCTWANFFLQYYAWVFRKEP